MNSYIIANFDRREYLRPEAFGEEATLSAIVHSREGVLAAFAVLLADGNGRSNGGGELRSDAAIIGTWAGCRVAIIDNVVTDDRLSEPGLEYLPLQHQLLAVGRDVSATALEALKEPERAWWACAALNPRHSLSLVMQRRVAVAGGSKLLSAEGRASPLDTLEELFGVLGVPGGITPYGTARQFQKGLNTMAPAFGLVNPWTVLRATFEHDSKRLASSLPGAHASRRLPSTGVVAVHLELRHAEAGEQTFSVRFGLNGDTPADVYSALFPAITFDRPVDVAAGVLLPEMARLLASLQTGKAAKP